MTEHRKFFLSPGQQSPEGSTSHGMPDGGIIWIGDTWTATELTNHVMSQEELDEYNLLLNYIQLPNEYGELISFETFKDPDAFETRKTAIKADIDNLTRSG